MTGFDHAAHAASTEQPRATPTRQTRWGWILFAVYLVLYGGFVLFCAFAPQVMARTPWAGINLAVLSGLGLIAAAFVLALFYDWLCRPSTHVDDREGGR